MLNGDGFRLETLQIHPTFQNKKFKIFNMCDSPICTSYKALQHIYYFKVKTNSPDIKLYNVPQNWAQNIKKPL